MKAPKLIKISDYARREKITTQAVYKRIDAKKLKTVKQFGLTLIVE